jgi:hypothetical protein
MNRNIFLISIILVCVLSVGCATTGLKKYDAGFVSSIGANNRIGIVEVKSWHRASPGAALLYGGGLLGAKLAEAVENNKKIDYKTKLDTECVSSIEDVLSSESGYSVVKSSEFKPQLADLVAGIKLDINYSYAAGWKKQVKLVINWTMLSTEGGEKVIAVTEELSDSAEEVSPNTSDPRYEATYVELARRSAISFLRMLKNS